jgi:serine/threonine protein phosphatase 1
VQHLAKAATQRLQELLTHPLDDKGRAYFVHPGAGRRLFITDVHGCYQTFEKLLKKVQLTPADQLFLGGDLVNRGPYSVLVMYKVWQLLADGYKLYPLRGNHEQLLLDFQREATGRLRHFAERQYSLHLLNADGSLPEHVNQYLGVLPYYYETEAEFIVHAGFETSQPDWDTCWKDMLWLRSFAYNASKLKNKRVVHGHVPTGWSAIQGKVKRSAPVLGLDNGCIRAKYPGHGTLLCYNLDTKEVIRQKNKDLRPAE